MRLLSSALLLSGSLLVCSCSDAPDAGAQQASAPSMRDRGQWAGTYRTTVPAPDGLSREVVVTLQDNNHFRLQVSGEGDAPPNVVSGEMMWKDGEHLVLPSDEDAFRNYKVEEGSLLLLDAQGQVVTGDAAERYRLQRQKEDYRLTPIEGMKWMLTELPGKEGAAAIHGDEYLQFNGASLSAYSGYNEVSAEYKLDPTTAKLIIGSLTLTPKGKADGTSDRAFLRALTMTRSCDVQEGQLLLRDKRGEVLARFKQG